MHSSLSGVTCHFSSLLVTLTTTELYTELERTSGVRGWKEPGEHRAAEGSGPSLF